MAKDTKKMNKSELTQERITLDLPTDLLNGVKAIAAKEYLSNSDVIRSAIKNLIANQKETKQN
jgi:metal-responsive CopG/Arc/MetJ family transcriptional regulator